MTSRTDSILYATDRAILVLVRENKRAVECAERQRLVLDALALRRGVIAPREVAHDAIDSP